MSNDDDSFWDSNLAGLSTLLRLAIISAALNFEHGHLHTLAQKS
jgi:hypothetical protein